MSVLQLAERYCNRSFHSYDGETKPCGIFLALDLKKSEIATEKYALNY